VVQMLVYTLFIYAIPSLLANCFVCSAIALDENLISLLLALFQQQIRARRTFRVRRYN